MTIALSEPGERLLGSVLTLKYGKSLPERTRSPGAAAVYGSNGVVGTHVDSLTSGPTIIVGRKGSIGEVHYSSSPCWPIDTTYYVDEFGDNEPLYLYWCLKSLGLDGLDRATAIPGLNREDAYRLPVFVPARQEQGRILARLAILFDQLNGARQELDHIPKLIERYKQSVLAAAFEGAITADWRHKHSVQCPEVQIQTAIDGRAGELNELPDSWAWRGFGDVATVTGGLTKNPTRHAFPLKMQYLRVANVYANELRLDQVEEIGVTPAEADRVRLRAGDLLIVEGNGSIDQIGRVALWCEEVANCGHQNHIIRASPLAGIVPKFLLYWLLSPAGRAAIEVVASSSSGLHTLSISKVRGLPVPLCAEAEMAVVVEEIERRFIAVDATFEQSSRAISLLDRLDQALLAKAFRGELVDQRSAPPAVIFDKPDLMERKRGTRVV